jgi:hypothetical protein
MKVKFINFFFLVSPARKMLSIMFEAAVEAFNESKFSSQSHQSKNDDKGEDAKAS